MSVEPAREGRAAAWILIAASPLFAAAGFGAGVPLLLPLLASAPAYTAMVLLLRRRVRAEAVAAMLVWALLLGATMTLLCTGFPERGARVVINGPAYWDEMSLWLETGVGREGDPSRFIPQHLAHAGLFVALSIVTASTVSILFGAVLMNYMAYYVARVILEAPDHPIAAGILGWHPWSVVRVAAYVILGVCLSEPLIAKLRGRPWSLAPARVWIGAAAAGLVIDIAMKAVLAPHWRTLLMSLR